MHFQMFVLCVMTTFEPTGLGYSLWIPDVCAVHMACSPVSMAAFGTFRAGETDAEHDARLGAQQQAMCDVLHIGMRCPFKP
jgi:hypothetical protein